MSKIITNRVRLAELAQIMLQAEQAYAAIKAAHDAPGDPFTELRLTLHIGKLAIQLPLPSNEELESLLEDAAVAQSDLLERAWTEAQQITTDSLSHLATAAAVAEAGGAA